MTQQKMFRKIVKASFFDVAKRAGHSRSDFTLSIYGHTLLNNDTLVDALSVGFSIAVVTVRYLIAGLVIGKSIQSSWEKHRCSTFCQARGFDFRVRSFAAANDVNGTVSIIPKLPEIPCMISMPIL